MPRMIWVSRYRSRRNAPDFPLFQPIALPVQPTSRLLTLRASEVIGHASDLAVLFGSGYAGLGTGDILIPVSY